MQGSGVIVGLSAPSAAPVVRLGKEVIRLGKEKALFPGDMVYAFGTPKELTFSMSRGAETTDTETTDTYSLRGFSRAGRALAKTCPENNE